MNVYRLGEDLKFVNRLGETLSIKEKLGLEIGIQRLLEVEKVDTVLFWGRIRGTVKDYYIAIGLKMKDEYEFPAKRFYWSSDNFVFAQLPFIIPEYAERCDGFRGMFTGNPNTVLYQKEAEENQDKPPEEVKPTDKDSLADSEDEAEEKNKKPIPDKFTEIDRLAFIIRAIENDCAILPLGAVKLTPSHELRFDSSFRGLNQQEANDLRNWQHFREPQTKEKMAIMGSLTSYKEREDAVFNKDFLDELSSDKPKGCWSCQCDDSRFNVTVRNLLWPGFLAYHEARTGVFGYGYFGNGLKNVELPFML